MNNNRKSAIKLFKLTYPEGKKDLYLGVDTDLSPDDLKVKYPQFHDCRFEQMTQYHPADTQDQ